MPDDMNYAFVAIARRSERLLERRRELIRVFAVNYLQYRKVLCSLSTRN